MDGNDYSWDITCEEVYGDITPYVPQEIMDAYLDMCESEGVR